MVEVVRSDFSRVFLIENKAGPANAPQYQGLWKAGAVSWEQGDVTTIKIPSETQYGSFKTIGKIPGESGDPELPIMARYTMDKSQLLRLARNGCDHDLQVHMGKCRDPRDFNGGWDKILILEAARITSYGTEDLGALGPDERAIVNEEVPFTGEDLYEVVRLSFSRQAESLIGREVKDVTVCDSKTCGLCGITSDGCQVVFGVVSPSSGSPGLLAEVVFTQDAGGTWDERVVTTLGASETPSAIVCVGTDTVVFSADSDSLHYIDTTDLLNGTGSWAEIQTGFVTNKGPKAVFSLGPSMTWVVGEGGYVYFTDDPTGGVSSQDAGSNTVQDLNAVHGADSLNLVAVGNSNAVLYTTNGGATWGSVTGPEVGANLLSVWAKTDAEWWVGTDTGNLYYTRNSGVGWTRKSFSGFGTGAVRDIKFVTPSVGYMAHNTATPAGRLFRTINGGFSWYALPEAGSLPANDRFNKIAVCGDPNIVFAGGLADDATDGILVKGA